LRWCTGPPVVAAVWLLAGLLTGAETDVRPPPIPAAVLQQRPWLDPNGPSFPDSSLVDFSYLLDPPSGKHGFLFAGRDNHFYFQDGTRGRFWGLNVAKDSVFQPHQIVDQAVATIARAGFNLVRLHHVDGVTGLLPPERAGQQERLDPDKLDALDYWIYKLKERGIYVYLDLLDYRTFQAAEQVPNAEQLGRGAKPCAVFNERLIELQLEYARALLVEHVNPYTKLSYAQDPTVCLLEICDENGLFIREKYWHEIPEPYATELRRRWNEWLRRQYQTTESLKAAWSDRNGACPLREGENLENASVRLPGLDDTSRLPNGLPRPSAAHHRDPCQARQNDLVRFCYSVHRAYFKRMKDALREQGVKIPITAVTDDDTMADLRAVADELDFIGNNFYYDHPLFARGKQWRLPTFFWSRNLLADGGVESLVPQTLISRAAHRPLVVREWSPCWPNKFRAGGMLEMAAYASLQDLDAVILFTYDTRPDNGRIGYFDVRRDPPRWGLAGPGAAIFLGQLIRPAKHEIKIAYSRTDTFFRLSGALPELYGLGWVARIGNALYDDVYDDQADLTVASGLTSGGAYPGKRCVIFANSKYDSLDARSTNGGIDERSGYGIPTIAFGSALFSFAGLLFDEATKVKLDPWPAFDVAAVRAQNFDPIGIESSGRACYGFFDPSRRNMVFKSLRARNATRVALDLLRIVEQSEGHTGGVEIGHKFVENRRYVSDTGELVRDETAGVLLVDALAVQACAGALARNTKTKTSVIALDSRAPIGVLLAITFDHKPVPESRRFVIKLVTVAVNTGESKRIHQHRAQGLFYALDDPGEPPVRTCGQLSTKPTVVAVGDRPLVEAFVTNGTWEIVRQREEAYVYCDTPGARFRCAWLGPKVELLAYTEQEQPSSTTVSQPFTYPQGVRFIRLRPSS